MYLGEDLTTTTVPYVFTPYLTSQYVVQWLDVMLDGVSLGVPATTLNEYLVMFDTGTTSFPMDQNVYNALMSRLTTLCNSQSLTCQDNAGNSLLTGGSVSMTLQQVNAFPTLTLTFWGVYMNIKPNVYLGLVSPGVRQIIFSPQQVTLIGDVILENLRLVVDQTGHRLGLAGASNCPSGSSSDDVWISSGPTPTPTPVFHSSG